MKQAGCRTGIVIQICDSKTSWKSCQERYEKMKETNPLLARAVNKAHHDLVIRQLPNHKLG
ncbi:zeta toxin family protein [uncultured Treponema sp.]|uniref:zeta toxin family protein n=1 Tax=uncultured Treponema sp. TaxID=162155 RepID=UPI00280AC973|nr:zeta toxin family protein [uncultured Treponema sp.]